MEERIRESLGRVVSFYEGNGIDVGGKPTFVYLEGEYSPLSKDVLAQVPGELKGVRDANERFSRFVIGEETPKFYRKHDVDVSGEAVDEQMRIQLARARELGGMTDESIERLQSYGVDILVFDRFREFSDANEGVDPRVYLDPLMAHEVWHVIEGRRGILDSLILEGTAEFARETYEGDMKRKGKVKAPKEVSEDPGRKAMVEVMAADMYQEGLAIVKRNADSLTDLFDMEKRGKMVRELERHMRSTVRSRIDATDDSTLAGRGAAMRLFYPGFDILDQGLTKENLLMAIREIGMNRTAEDLSSQDLSKLLQFYSSLGYGKN